MLIFDYNGENDTKLKLLSFSDIPIRETFYRYHQGGFDSKTTHLYLKINAKHAVVLNDDEDYLGSDLCVTGDEFYQQSLKLINFNLIVVE